VNLSVIYLRRSRPNLKRTFRVPLYPATPILGTIMCIYLMANLDAVTWWVFGAWMLVGIAAYFGYGRRNSRVAALSQGEYQRLSAVQPGAGTDAPASAPAGV
jgi:APA family basic amino acid/polyamine antiporter